MRPRRVVLAILAIACFAAISSMFSPRGSSAVEPPARNDLVIGTLAGPQYHVRITAGRYDPLYTVMTPAGEVLEADLLAHEVYHFFPDLDVTKLRAGGDAGVGPLMLVE